VSSYRRLGALVADALLVPMRLLYGQPALYVATRDGLEWASLHEFDVCRVSVALARHWALCARLAVILKLAEVLPSQPRGPADAAELALGRRALGRRQMAAAVEDPQVEVVAAGEPAEDAVERQLVAARAGEA
jgi:hypothetical protein